MKILITGVTKLQSVEDFYLSQELKVIPSELALVRALRELGHEVEMKRTNWGDNLDKYDRVITYLACTNAYSALYTDGVLWALKREDTLVAIDDWQFHLIYTNGTNPSTAKRKWVSGATDLVRQLNNCPASKEEIDELHYDWANNRKMLLPAFNGGDLQQMFAFFKRSKRWKDWFATQHTELFGYDPNPWLPLRVPQNPSIPANLKKKEWVAAGLGKQNREYLNKWKLTQPIVELGGRGKNRLRMPESQAVEWFGERWLHAIPGYNHAGSGWWRSRPSQLAGHEVVSYCHPKEGAIYGPSWVINNPLELEEMTEKQLEDLGKLQSAEFFERHPIGEEGKPAGLNTLTTYLQ